MKNRATVMGEEPKRCPVLAAAPAHPRPEGAQGRCQSRNRIRGSEEGTPRGAAARTVPRQPLSRCETHGDETNPKHLLPERGGCAWGCGTCCGMWGRAVWGCTRLLMGCSRDEPNMGKGMELSDLGRNKCGKIER